jgi:hypothetical protein
MWDASWRVCIFTESKQVKDLDSRKIELLKIMNKDLVQVFKNYLKQDLLKSHN